MRKQFVRHAARKFLCLALSMMLSTAGAAAALASSAKAAAGKVSEDSPVQLTCETENLNLADNGRSTVLHLCLIQEDNRIRQRIYREDIVLGGVFRDMIVSGVRNDRKTILLDLIGVPDLSGAGAGTPMQGTMEFPGFLFGCDDSVEASAAVTGKEAAREDLKPSFSPYFNGMRVSRDEAEIDIVLIPAVGEFAGDFGADDIRFGRGMKDAKIRSFKDTGDGSRELIVSIPAETVISDENGLYCFGSILLSAGSMVSPGGKTYEKELCAVRKFSVETAGRDFTKDDVNALKMDARAMNDFVNLFGETSFGTIGKTVYGGLSAMSAGYTILSLVGILPSSNGNAKIVQELQSIHNTLNEVNEKCEYMSGVLDIHTKMITDMGVKLDEQYLGGFNADFGSMTDAMNLLEDEVGNPWVRRQIEEAIEIVAEKYETEQKGTGRDFDEDLEEIVPDPEYYESDYILSEEEAASASSDMDVLEALASDPEYGQNGYADEPLFVDDDAGADIPDALPAEDDTAGPAEMAAEEEETEGETQGEAEESTQELPPSEEEAPQEETLPAAAEDVIEEDGLLAAEDAGLLSAVPPASGEAAPQSAPVEAAVPAADEDAIEEDDLMAAAEDAIEEDDLMAAAEDEEAFVPELIEENTENTQPEPDERILDAYETQMYLMDLNHEIGKIHLTANITIGDLLRKIAADYSTLSKRFDTNDNSNPIVAYCNAHEGTDNFATTSLGEKEMYKQNIRYQLSRALTILSAMDSPTAYKRAITNLQNKDTQKTWPNVEKNVRDSKGNPYCFLLEGYVRLATTSEIEDWWDPLKNPGSKNYKDKVQRTNRSGQNASIEEFYRRMHGRNLEQELELAEIRNLKSVRQEGFGGMTFSYERWGVKNGNRKYERNYYAWTDSVRYADPDSVYDHVNWGGQLLRHDNSYIIVATPYIRWTAGPGDHPAESLLYQGDDKSQSIMYRMTTLVNP